MKQRLDKLLGNRTPHSRSEVKALLRQGAVQVNGSAEKDGSRLIDPETDKVSLRGKPLRMAEHTYYLLNKPLNVVCATEDREHRTVIDLIPPEERVKGLFPAGRLDADSTGLVLLTEDGDLAHRMLSPRSHVPKCYLVRLARPYEAACAEALRAGLTLGDGTVCLPAEVLPVPEETHWALICLHEGKYHQVRRMMAALGNHVEQLHRVSAGSLLLPPELAPGAHLEVLHKDVENMLKQEPLSALAGQIFSNFSSYLINAGKEV